MKARMFVTLCLAATLMAPALAAPSPTAVVQDYLTDRDAHRLTDAYALLSPVTQQQIPLKDWMTQRTLPPDPVISPAWRALFALIFDTGTPPPYAYHVTSADPSDAQVVLVNAQSRGDAKTTLTLKIVTIADPQAGGTPRLDLLQSLERTDPEASHKAKEEARTTASMSNLKQITLAIMQYAQNHKGRLPDADRWTDEILPLFLSPKGGSQSSPSELEHFATSLFRDPAAPEGLAWTYAFNRNLSGLQLSRLKDPANTVLVFESTTGVKNTADTGQSLPHPGWHSEGSHVAFADGHVKLIPDKPTTDTPAPKFTP
ncbi:MAG: DUF1559 domain-containing protein [Armatimonadota bacterium]|nr:DUF1559 domain-containing protein [Armatimonadota bacterium]